MNHISTKKVLSPLIIICIILFQFQAIAKKPKPDTGYEIRTDESEQWEIKDNMLYSKITGYPLALYDLNFPTIGVTPEGRALHFIETHKEILGIRDHEIEQLKLHFIRESDAGTTVRFRQHYQGIPVGKSEITVSMDKDNVVRYVANSFRQGIDIGSANFLITPEYASMIAIKQIRAEGEMRHFSINPTIYWNNNTARLAYKVIMMPGNLMGEWHVFVDGLTSEIFKAVDEAHYHNEKDGTCSSSCSHTLEEANNKTSNFFMASGTGPVFDPDPLSSANATYGTGGFVDNNDADSPDLAGQVMTKTLLDITFTGVEYQLIGPYAAITELEAPTKGLFSQATNTFSFNRFEDGFEATNTYYHVDYSMRYLNVTLGCNIMPYQYGTGVKFDPHAVGGDDNSYYSSGSGAIYFGEGCVDDAEDSDVIHHELGHGLHDWVTAGGLSQQQGLSEGCGDYWAASYNRGLGDWDPSDPAYYYMFNWDGHNTCWNGRQLNVFGYPDALVGQIHTDGQLWASCLMTIWDVVGQQKLDKAFWEGLGMTNGSTNQNSAAVAVYQAAINLGYTNGEILAIHSGFEACGYTMPALPKVSFTTASTSLLEGDGCTTTALQRFVVMDAAPTATTTITFSIGGTSDANDGTITTSSVVFTTSNWNVPQPVDIIINADKEVETDETFEVLIDNVTGSLTSKGTVDRHIFTVNNDDSDPTSGTITETVYSNDASSIASWIITNGSGDAYTWEVSTGYSGNSANSLDGSSFLFIDADAPPNNTTQDEIAESMAFDATGYTTLTLSFDQYYNANNGDITTVDVWDGAVWQNVYTRNAAAGDIGNWGAPDQQSIDITAHANASMKVRFHYVGNRDMWWAIDNIMVQGQKPTVIQTAVNTGNPDAQYLGPNQTIHYLDPVTGNLMCTIENLSAHDYGCTNVYIENAGTSFMQVANYSDPAQLFFNKAFRIVPTTNNPSGTYNITFYLTAAEKAGWELGGTRDWNLAEIVKTADAITAMTSVTPFEQGATSRGTINSDFSITHTFATGFSGFGFAQALPPLPVELVELETKANEETIDLFWATASEVNNAGFEIERSTQPNSGFEYIGWVEGNGTSNEMIHYSFEDRYVEKGITYYYRLRQVDFNEEYEFSNIVSAKIEDAKKNIAFSIFPNPVDTYLNINFGIEQNQDIHYNIIDVQGRLLYSSFQEGNRTTSLQIDVSSLAAGVYFIQVQNQYASKIEKFVVH